ncbi:hypothetical protein ACSBR2_025074 [Camellia fascicularis]
MAFIQLAHKKRSTKPWKQRKLRKNYGQRPRSGRKQSSFTRLLLFSKSTKLPAKDAVTECAEEGVRILGEGKFLESDSFLGNERTKYCLTSKIPLGVILAIPPFKYPINLAVSKIGPTLIAGNSHVLKPPTKGFSHIS